MLSHALNREERFGSPCSSGPPPRGRAPQACSELGARTRGKFAVCAPPPGNGEARLRCSSRAGAGVALANVTSTATCAPWKEGRPFATTSKRRASVMGSPRFRSRRKTSVATRPPASRQIWATVRSTGTARRTKTPAVAQAARWSPKMSSSLPQRHARAVGGKGRRKRRSKVTRNASSCIVANHLSNLPGERWVVRALNWFPEKRSTSWPPCLHLGFDDSTVLQAQSTGKLATTCPGHPYLMNPLDEFISFTES